MSAQPEESQPNTGVLLAIAPIGLRERRASAHAPPNVRSVLEVTGISAVPENTVLDIDDIDPVQEDGKHPAAAPTIPTLSQLPSLYIDKQSASISGYTPGTLTPRYSASNTPGVSAREACFEDSFGFDAPILDHEANTPRLKRRLALSFFGFFCAGWSDGSW
jgi:hypothetical protein